tara:strand:+ start:4375 stop:5199 length:825 start_codon:yes stop_codon:yes gene_type:complete
MATQKNNKDKKKKVSRGQQRYTLVSDVKKSQEEYEAQAKKEAEKAGKRSLWSTVGGLVGAGLGLMAAPALIAGAGIAAGTTLAAGATGLVTGGVSLAGGVVGKKGSEAAGQKRKDIKVDKFYTKAADEATQTFKDYDKAINKSIQTQALVSGALAAAQAGGVFKKGKELIGKGLKGGGKTAATTVDMSYATEAVAEVPLNPVDKKILEQSVSKPMSLNIDIFGPASDKSLFANVKQSLSMAAASKTLDYVLGKTQPKGSQFGQMEEIDYPNYIT